MQRFLTTLIPPGIYFHSHGPPTDKGVSVSPWLCSRACALSVGHFHGGCRGRPWRALKIRALTLEKDVEFNGEWSSQAEGVFFLPELGCCVWLSWSFSRGFLFIPRFRARDTAPPSAWISPQREAPPSPLESPLPCGSLRKTFGYE